MANDNQYGEFLRFLLNAADEKVGTLADRLGYDISYISKWVTGSRLPSERSADRIHADIARFFAERLSVSPNRQAAANILGHAYREELSGDKLARELETALETLLSAKYAECLSGPKKSQEDRPRTVDGPFVFRKEDLVELMRGAVLRQANARAQKIVISSTLDIYGFFKDQIIPLFELISLMGLSVSFSQVVDQNAFRRDQEAYFDNIVKTLSVSNAPQLSLYSGSVSERGHIIVIKDVMAFQLLIDGDELLVGCYSYADDVVSSMAGYCSAYFRKLSRFLFPLYSRALVHSSTWSDFYTQKQIRIFLSGAPSLFLPLSLIDQLMEAQPPQNEDECNYFLHLRTLAHTWEQKTRSSDMRIILFKSRLLDYLHSGVMDLAQRRFALTTQQRLTHINHFSDVLRANSNIRIRLIDDIASSIHRLRYGVSMFVSPSETILEKSSAMDPGQSSYHKLGHAEDVALFWQYFGQVMENRYVTDLGTEELLEYMRFNVSLSEEFPSDSRPL